MTAVESKSLAELQKVGLAVSVSQFNGVNREVGHDAFFAEIPKEGLLDFELAETGEKRVQRGEILEELLMEFGIA